MVAGYSIRVAEAIKEADGDLIGVQLGRLCLERDLSVADVAGMLGVSRQTLYGWFSGAVEPQPYHQEMIKVWIDTLNANSRQS